MANQRARICGAMIEAVAEQGYPAVSVAGLCRLAGVSKRAYYELFANKEACLVVRRDEADVRFRSGTVVHFLVRGGRFGRDPRL
jgi:AcrR family transcriptional regulator